MRSSKLKVEVIGKRIHPAFSLELFSCLNQGLVFVVNSIANMLKSKHGIFLWMRKRDKKNNLSNARHCAAAFRLRCKHGMPVKEV